MVVLVSDSFQARAPSPYHHSLQHTNVGASHNVTTHNIFKYQVNIFKRSTMLWFIHFYNNSNKRKSVLCGSEGSNNNNVLYYQYYRIIFNRTESNYLQRRVKKGFLLRTLSSHKTQDVFVSQQARRGEQS